MTEAGVLYGPDNKPLPRSRKLTRDRYTRASYGLSRLVGQLPDPDTVWKKAGLDYWALRALTFDAHLYGVMQSRAAGLASLELRITEPEGADKKSKMAAQLFRDICENLRGHDEDQDVQSLIALLATAPHYGFSGAELTWQTNSREWRPTRFRDLPQEWFGWDADKGILRFYPIGNPTGEEIPKGKILLARHKPTQLIPMGEKILSRCFWPVTFKKGGLRFWANMLEHYGQPWLIAKSGMADADDLLSKLEGMIQSAIAVLPSDMQLDIKEAGSGRGQDFSLFHEIHNTEMSKAVLSHSATADATPGKLGNEQNSENVRYEVVYSDARLVASTLNRLARLVTDYNYGLGTVAPLVEFYEEEDPKKEKLERDKMFVDFGFRPKQEYLEREYSVKLEPFVSPSPQSPPFKGEENSGKNSLFNALLNARAAEDFFIDELVKKLSNAATGEVDVLVSGIVEALQATDSYAQLDAATLALANKEPPSQKQFAGILRDAAILAHGVGQTSGGSDMQTANTLLRNSADYEVKLGSLKPEEAIQYLESKGVRLSWNWYEVWQQEHASAFTVAKAMRLDILTDIRTAVQTALADGTTFAQFKKELAPKLKEKGWWGLQEMEVPGTGGEKETVQLGSSFRLETIYHVNLQTSYQTGKWRGLQQNKDARPYLVYSAVMDARTRPSHAALHGQIYLIDDPFWDEWYPPNGWRCRCTVYSLSADEFNEMSAVTGGVVPPADEIAPVEWRYNVGIADKREGALMKMLNEKQGGIK